MQVKIFELILTVVAALGLGCLLTGIFFMYKEEKRNKTKKFIDFFGVRMEVNEYMSFVASMISYLVVDDNNELDLSKFLDTSKIRYNRYKESFYILEATINLFPLVSCKYLGNGKYCLDASRTIDKFEEYQRNTGMDDYILPLIPVELIEKYPALFNYPTRVQEYATKSTLINHDIFGGNFRTAKEIVSECR